MSLWAGRRLKGTHRHDALRLDIGELVVSVHLFFPRPPLPAPSCCSPFPLHRHLLPPPPSTLTLAPRISAKGRLFGSATYSPAALLCFDTGRTSPQTLASKEAPSHLSSRPAVDSTVKLTFGVAERARIREGKLVGMASPRAFLLAAAVACLVQGGISFAPSAMTGRLCGSQPSGRASMALRAATGLVASPLRPLSRRCAPRHSSLSMQSSGSPSDDLSKKFEQEKETRIKMDKIFEDATQDLSELAGKEMEELRGQSDELLKQREEEWEALGNKETEALIGKVDSLAENFLKKSGRLAATQNLDLKTPKNPTLKQTPTITPAKTMRPPSAISRPPNRKPQIFTAYLRPIKPDKRLQERRRRRRRLRGDGEVPRPLCRRPDR